MRGTWGTAILIAALAGLVGVAGCHKGTPTTCKGWAKLLKSPVRSRDAIKGLGDLGNNCKEFLPALEEVFPASQYKDEILQTVKAINAPKESVSLLTTALRNPMTATLAAAVAEDFAIPELRGPIVEILTTDAVMKARENALKALARIDAQNLKQDEDLLIALLRADPNIQGIQVNALAAKLLGQIRSDKAVPDLVVAMFLRTQRGAQLYTPVRKALAGIGPTALAPLVALVSGDEQKAADLFRDLRDTAKKMGLFDWQWLEGPEPVQVLGDLGDPAAAPALAACLARPLNPPVGVEDRVLRAWQVAQQNRITMCMMGLWKVGDASVIASLKDVVLNPENDAKQRLDTASAIALLPGFAGVGAVVDIYRNSKDPRFRAPLLKPISLGMDWANLDAFRRLLQAEKSELVRARVEGQDEDAREFQATMSVLNDCRQGDTDCLVQKLRGGDPVIGRKAAILLAGMADVDRAKALQALFEVYPTTDPVGMIDFRRFILLAIWRLGDARNVPDLERLLKADRDRKGAGYWVDEIETLIPAMARKT